MSKKFEHLEGVNGESVRRPVMFSITKTQKSSILQIVPDCRDEENYTVFSGAYRGFVQPLAFRHGQE